MSNTHKQHSEKVDQDKGEKIKVQNLDHTKETSLSRKRNFKLEYQMFSDVIQKALKSVEMHTMHSKQESKVTEQNTPFNKITGTDCNMVTSPRKINVHVTSVIARTQHKSLKNEKSDTFKRKQTARLKDVEDVIKYIDYGNSILSQALDLYHKTLSEINDLKDGIKLVEAAVHKVQQSELLAELSGKVNDDDFDTMINLSEDIVDNGKVILSNAHEVLKSYNYVVESNLQNLISVSKAVSKLCSVQLETLLDDYRYLVVAVIKKVNDKIKTIYKVERKVSSCYKNLQPKLGELRCMSAKFFPLVFKLVDMMFEYGLEFSIEN